MRSLAVVLLATAFGVRVGRCTTTLTVDPAVVLNTVERGVYGHFLEHIYHSCHGGLWGEILLNRSFEEAGQGEWSVEGDVIRQSSNEPDQRLVFGDPGWTDVEFSFEARKLGGREGFLAIVRAAGPDQFYWANLGGWGNVRHQFEKCAPTAGRQAPVGEATLGSIDTGRWYRVRVRVEGGRLQAWLDDQPILEWLDPSPISAGCVGIGTWETRAEFRNLRVTTPEGQPLWEGLPPIPLLSARHWGAFGESCQVASVSGESANGRRHVRVRGEGPAAAGGVRQSNLCVRAGDVLRGSLWLSGRLPSGLCVRLVDGEGLLGETALAPTNSDEWIELPIALTPARGARNAAVELLVRGPADVRLDQVVLMPDSARATGGFRPDLLGALAELRPPLIRWPGGAYAEHYRWRHGVGPQIQRRPNARPLWDDLDVNAFGTDEFLALCRRLGAEPVLVINTGRHDPATPRATYLQEALEWIEYCNGPADSPMGRERARNGHPEPYRVRMWEIDNEAWIINDVETYIQIVREFAPALRKACPEGLLIACGGSGLSTERHGRWDPRLIEACAELVDAISIHHYEHPDRFARGPAEAERWFADLRELIRRSKNPRLKVFVSEWNAQSTDWRTGLYAAGLLNAMERCGDVVTMASPALLLRHVSARAWDNALINFDSCGWFPAPNWVVMRLWREHAARERLAISVDGPSVDAVAVRREDGKIVVKLVNPAAEPQDISVRLRSGPVEKGRLVLIAPGHLRARNTLEQPNAVAPCDAAVEIREGAARFQMPALSAGVLLFDGQ
ncbi:MAG: DUF1080 domain-containing protein [Kiritimatiellae bacterium]|nr:DUF1080 domain-containing protein [Kiritimatiellia bacterium]